LAEILTDDQIMVGEQKFFKFQKEGQKNETRNQTFVALFSLLVSIWQHCLCSFVLLRSFNGNGFS